MHEALKNAICMAFLAECRNLVYDEALPGDPLGKSATASKIWLYTRLIEYLRFIAVKAIAARFAFLYAVHRKVCFLK